MQYALKHPKRQELKGRFQKEVKTLEGVVLDFACGDSTLPSRYETASRLFAVDKSPKKISSASSRTQQLELEKTNFVVADGESLPFEENFFDAIVVSFALCSVANTKVYYELYRVAKPRARIVILEHVQSKSVPFALVQHVSTPVYRMICGNCHLNRDPLPILKSHGFVLQEVTYSSEPFIPWLLIIGNASK